MAASVCDISIIIVNYNVKDYLLQCLRSIENAAKGLQLEIIVVDNNSNDDSVRLLKPLFPNVKFIELEENIGFGRANNIGIKQAAGKYVLILNPDTLLNDNTLVTMFEYMERNPQVGIAGCKVLNSDGSFQLACRRGFPTPWASFSKLFGLQSLFPNSKLFAQYNQTFRSIDETYYIDSVIGAFMFCQRELLIELGGFDEDYFMYGEDLDLCFKAKKAAYHIAYVHSTSIIHFKGESTKRSSINELKHFYDAMEIFAKKHYSGSFIFLMFIRFGIFIRSILAYILKFKRDFILIFLDLIIINTTFIFATNIRFGGFFNLPDYAYPTVFIVLSSVMLISMIMSGAYFENKNTVRRSVTALMITFFFLSSLTYFFREYAFSRGVLLMTIGSSLFLTSLVRIIILLIDKISLSKSSKRIIIVGDSEKNNLLINEIERSSYFKAEILGLVSVGNQFDNRTNYPTIGNIEYINKIIESNNINQVLITDERISHRDLIQLMISTSDSKVKFHLVNEFEDLLISNIVNEINGEDPKLPEYNISKFRVRFYKRISDIFVSLFLLTIGLPVLYLFFSNEANKINKVWNILIGKMTFVGINPRGRISHPSLKPGLIGLYNISEKQNESDYTIDSLNDYYLRNVNISLDFDILLKYIFRDKIGNKTYS